MHLFNHSSSRLLSKSLIVSISIWHSKRWYRIVNYARAYFVIIWQLWINVGFTSLRSLSMLRFSFNGECTLILLCKTGGQLSDAAAGHCSNVTLQQVCVCVCVCVNADKWVRSNDCCNNNNCGLLYSNRYVLRVCLRRACTSGEPVVDALFVPLRKVQSLLCSKFSQTFEALVLLSYFFL
jgi:hypothetical protein